MCACVCVHVSTYLYVSACTLIYSLHCMLYMQQAVEYLTLWEGYSKDKASWILSEDVGLEAIRYS